MRHAMKYEGAGLGTTGLAEAHGFLSGDRGASYGGEAQQSRKRFRPIGGPKAIGAPADPPSAQARIGSHADLQLGMDESRADDGHGHELHMEPIAEATEQAGDYSYQTPHVEDDPINLSIEPTNVPIADVGPADVTHHEAYTGGDDFLDADAVDSKAQNMLDNIGDADKFDAGNPYHLNETQGRHQAATSHTVHDHDIRGVTQADDEDDRAEPYGQTPGGGALAGMVNPFEAEAADMPGPLVRQDAEPTNPFAGGGQFQYVGGGSPPPPTMPDGSGVPPLERVSAVPKGPPTAEKLKNPVASCSNMCAAARPRRKQGIQGRSSQPMMSS